MTYQSTTRVVRRARAPPRASQSSAIGTHGLAQRRRMEDEPTDPANSVRRRLDGPAGEALPERQTTEGGHMASIETPRELFIHKLGAALTMEETILEMLKELQDEASTRGADGPRRHRPSARESRAAGDKARQAVKAAEQ